MYWNPSADGKVRRLVVDGNTIYAVGDFHTIGGLPRQFIAALDTKTGAATSWNPIINIATYSLAVNDHNVYVGGDFSAVNGRPRTNFAVLLAEDH